MPPREQRTVYEPANESLYSASKEWILSIPLVTRFLFCGFILTSFGGNFGIPHYSRLLFIPELISQRWEIWRLFSAFFFAPFNPGFILTVLYLYQSSLDMETYVGNTAEYAYLVFFNMNLILLSAYILGWPYLLASCLVMALTSISSALRPDRIVRFFFGISFKAMYLPFFLVLFDLVSGQIDSAKILGLAVGYVYYYVSTRFPQVTQTPQLFRLLFPPPASEAMQPGGNGGQGFYRSTPGGRAAEAEARETPSHPGLRYRWGTGRSLGNN